MYRPYAVALAPCFSGRPHATFESQQQNAPMALDELMSHAQGSLAAVAFDDDTQDTDNHRLDWSEDDIVLLHWRLLQEVRHLADPATPLEEKLDTLRWVFTEREKDGLPFSFANCLRVVGNSPLSPIAYCGLVDADEVRDRISHGLKTWLSDTLARYPDWVRLAVVSTPEWVEAQLTRNPQWINEQIKQMSMQGDLFV